MLWVMNRLCRKRPWIAHTQGRYSRTLARFSYCNSTESYAFSGPFEMATGVVDFQRALELEDLLRHHPIAKDLNRAWMVVAQKK